MKRSLILALACLLTLSAFAQNPDGGTKAKTQKSSSHSVFPNQIQELKDALAAQQEQIKQLQQQISTRDTAIQQLQQQVGQVNSAANQAQQTAQSALAGEKQEGATLQTDFATLQHDVTDLKSGQASIVGTLTETQKRVGDLEAPLSIHYKGVSITPGGFLEGATVWRQRATLGDINTNMNGIPFSAAGQAQQSEFYGSGRQSRLSFLIQGKWGTTNLTGYYEMDFLGVGVTSNANQSNSYVMRQRQAWAQAAFHNGWTITGGQMWSLVAETRKGLDPRTEALPLQIDTQYVAGLTWAREYGFRVTKNFNNRAWVGFAVENAQTTVGVSGANVNFLIGGPGQGGGLYNALANYASDVAPDFVVKGAFEPKFGGHYEVYGLISSFRERVYPNAFTSATNSAAGAIGAYNNTNTWGGFGANARWLLAHKKVETAVHFMTGNAVGRYGNSGLPDVTVYGDGKEHPLRSYQALYSLEYHLPKWDFYGYAGGEYVGKNWAPFYTAAKPLGVAVGYGSPWFNNSGCGTEVSPVGTTAGVSNFNNGFPINIGSGQPGANAGLNGCTGQTQSIAEGTVGFWYKPYNGPKGRVQFGLQYSYIARNAWVGYGAQPANGGIPLPPYAAPATRQPEAVNNMIFTSFRYYLP